MQLQNLSRMVCFYWCVDILLLLVISAQTDGVMNNCSRYDVISSEKSPEVEFDERLVPDVIVTIVLSGQLCTVNITDIYAEISLFNNSIISNDSVYIRLRFECPLVRTKIQFETTGIDDGNKLNSLISLVVNPCIISVESLNKLSSVGKLTSLATNFENVVEGNITCEFSNTIQSLSLVADPPCQPERYCRTFFELCDEPLIGVFSLVFGYQINKKYQVTSSFVDMLRDRLPNLQILSFLNVQLLTNLRFPWTSTFVDVLKVDRDNVSFLQKQPSQRWFRSFTITNTWKDKKQSNLLNQIEFVGGISSIQINGVYGNFSKYLFYNINGLEKIDLSRNNLESIPQGLFKNQDHLYKLVLKENLLKSLPPKVFDLLKSLKDLDLSHNRLYTLSVDVFKSLTSMEKVHLENNLLQELPATIFKNQLQTLVEVYLYSNPLTTIPINVLYAPFLKILDIHNSSVNDHSFYEFLLHVDLPDIQAGTTFQTRNLIENLNPKLSVAIADKTIDLSFSQIRSFSVYHGEYFERYWLMFRELMKSLKIDFGGNPINCACKISLLQTLFRTNPPDTSQFNGNAQFTGSSLVCQTPAELKGRKLLSISREEMYCPVADIHCPAVCVCYARLSFTSLIIDCRHTNITTLPSKLPHKSLELWFHNSGIQQITAKSYFENITFLDVSNCKVHYIEHEAFKQFRKLQVLYLDSNLLSTLPVEIRNVSLKRLTLKNNPFICDCHLGWMKEWLLNRESPVIDWRDVKCTDNLKKGIQLIKVEDEKFICRADSGFNSVQHVIVPSVIIGCFIFLLTVLIFVICFYRLTIKVLLYLIFGIHPFDNDSLSSINETFDAVAIYSFEDQEFMHQSVVDYLNDNGYRVADMYRDFIVGVSFTDNVKHFIRKSRRMIMCLSLQTFDDGLMQIAWRKAYEKVVETRSNFTILIQNDFESKYIREESLLRYFQNRRYVKKKSPLFQKCLSYLMPKKIVRIPEQYQNDSARTRTLISYPDNVHYDITQGLIPCLREFGYEIRVLEYEFVPGGAIGEEIINTIESAERIIFILSNEVLKDEIKILILKIAIAKTMTCDYNFLMLFTHGKVYENEMSNDIRNYVDTYVTACMDEANFLQRLLCGLEETRRTFGAGEEMHQAGSEDAVELQDGIMMPFM